MKSLLKKLPVRKIIYIKIIKLAILLAFAFSKNAFSVTEVTLEFWPNGNQKKTIIQMSEHNSRVANYYEDGEIEKIEFFENNQPSRKIDIIRSQENPFLRKWVNSNWTIPGKDYVCKDISEYILKDLDFEDDPSKRNFHWNRIVLSNKFCDQNGNIRTTDDFFTAINEESPTKRTLLDYNGNKISSFEYLYDKNQKIYGFVKEKQNKSFYYDKNEKPLRLQSVSLSAIKTAFIDTGIDYNHPVFKSKLWNNPKETKSNGIDDDKNGFIDDIFGFDIEEDSPYISEKFSPIENKLHHSKPFSEKSFPAFHGTHVAGIIAKNSTHAKIISLKGDITTRSTWNDIDLFLSKTKVDVLNMSMAIDRHRNWAEYPTMPGIYDLINDNNGTVFVFAAGNAGVSFDERKSYESIPVTYNHKNSIIVASTTGDSSKNLGNSLADFSNYGVLDVDIAAPGKDVLSAEPGGSYTKLTGTSMAAPFVAAIASDVLYALLKNSVIKRKRNHKQVALLTKKIILASATVNLNNPLPVRSGGVINPKNAIKLANAIAKSQTPFSQETFMSKMTYVFGDTKTKKRLSFWKKHCPQGLL